MVEQLSPGATLWYEAAARFRAENSSRPRNEWDQLFNEFRMVDHATLMTYCHGNMDEETHAQINRAIISGYFALHRAHRMFGRNTHPDQVNFVTGELQARMYMPLFRFLHPEVAAQMTIPDPRFRKDDNEG